MIHEIKRTGMRCPDCKAILLINGERLYCQICREPKDPKRFRSMKLEKWM